MLGVRNALDFRFFQSVLYLHLDNEISRGGNLNLNMEFTYVSHTTLKYTLPEGNFIQYFYCTYKQITVSSYLRSSVGFSTCIIMLILKLSQILEPFVF